MDLASEKVYVAVCHCGKHLTVEPNDWNDPKAHFKCPLCDGEDFALRPGRFPKGTWPKAERVII
jgi:hypothetical protein